MKSRFRTSSLRHLCAICMGMVLLVSGAVAQMLDWQGLYNLGSNPAAARGGIVHFTDGSSVTVGEAYTSNGNYDIYVLHHTGSPNDCYAPDWQFTYHIGGNDYGRKIRKTADGGYIVVGTTDNTGSPCGRLNDIFLLKLTSTGAVSWAMTYGGSGSEKGYDVLQLADGGYIVAGSTNSWGAGDYDAYLLKVNSTGVPVWGRAYGGAHAEEFRACMLYLNTGSPGDIIAVGSTLSNTFGGSDFFVARVNPGNGAPIAGYPTNYGGVGNEEARAVHELINGGIAMCGYTQSYNGVAEGYLLVLNFLGTPVAGHFYGSSLRTGWDELTGITDLPGGDIMVSGYFTNPAGGFGKKDAYIGRVNSTTLLPVSQLLFGGIEDDEALAITSAKNGSLDGWMAAGYSKSYYFGVPEELYIISRPDMALRNCNDRVPTITHADVKFTRGNTYSNFASFQFCTAIPTRIEVWDFIYFCGSCEAGRAGQADRGGISEDRGPGSTVSPANGLNSSKVSSVDESGDATAALYPNPVRSGSSFAVAVPAGSGPVSITVTDMTGTVVYNRTASGAQVSIDTKGWSSGAYAVRLSRGSESVTRQIVVTD